MEKKRILAIDNDDLTLKGIEVAFSDEADVEVVPALGGLIGLELFKQDPDGFDLVLLDFKMPVMRGDEVARELKKINPRVVIAMLSGVCQEEIGQLAADSGAQHFIEKPNQVGNLVARVKLIMAQNPDVEVNVENEMRGNAFKIRRVLDQIGCSRDLIRISELVEMFAPFTESVIIRGESGVGKEGIARAIHRNSGRKGKFVPVNCAAIPNELLESQMFGHEKGAFSGAIGKQVGYFEEADHGTIFLDEIGDLPSELQAKLLRVLQDKVVQPVGGRPRQVDFRVVSATHCDLEQSVKSGRFRADLYYRLNTFSIDVPPLRERVEDIEPLFWHFLGRLEAARGKKKSVASSVLRRLKSMSWPNNIRGLEHVVINAYASSGNRITEEHLFEQRAGVHELEEKANRIKVDSGSLPTHKEFSQIVEGLERWLYEKALTLTGGKKGQTAELLKMNPNTLNYRLVKLGMEKDELFWNKNTKKEEGL